MKSIMKLSDFESINSLPVENFPISSKILNSPRTPTLNKLHSELRALLEIPGFVIHEQRNAEKRLRAIIRLVYGTFS